MGNVSEIDLLKKVEQELENLIDNTYEARDDLDNWLYKYATLAAYHSQGLVQKENVEQSAIKHLVELIEEAWLNSDSNKKDITDSFGFGDIEHESYDEGTPFEDYEASIEHSISSKFKKVRWDNLRKEVINLL